MNCSEALFQLSLSAAGKRAMRAHDGCMRVLRQRALATEDVEVGARCRGALAAMEERRGGGEAPSAAAAGAGHLMISYQWDMQATVLRIAASMRTRGFRVWVDTEMMSGSTLDAMAAAVEGAHCVLICITERYKASANCRLEGTCESLAWDRPVWPWPCPWLCAHAWFAEQCSRSLLRVRQTCTSSASRGCR